MGSGKPTQRRYSKEEKAQAVRLVRQLRAESGTEHGTVFRVANQLGYGVESVRSWVKQADIDEGVTAGVTSARRQDQGARAGEPGAAPGQRDLESERRLSSRRSSTAHIEDGRAFIDAHRD